MKQVKVSKTAVEKTRRGRPAISDEKKRAMREKIATATQCLFQTEGYRQISMRRIAAEVGCSPMTLYKYYGSKIDILHTLWEGIFGELFDKLDSLDLNQAASHEQLILLSSGYVDYWLENTDHYRLVFMTEGVNQTDVSVFLENPNVADRYQVFAMPIAQASTAKSSDHELMQKLDALMCFLQGIAHNLITISGHSWPAGEYLVGAAVRGVLDGDISRG